MAEKKLYFQLELDSSSAYQFSKAMGSNVKKAGILCHSGVTAGCPVAGQAGTAHVWKPVVLKLLAAVQT